jgi:hypothetical protein
MTEDRLPLAELLQKAGEGDFLRAVAEVVVQLLMEADGAAENRPPILPGARVAVRPGRLRLARECRHGPRRGAPGSSAGSPGVPAGGARGAASLGRPKGHSLSAAAGA